VTVIRRPLVRIGVSQNAKEGRSNMQLYAILRRNGWPTPEDLQAAAKRSGEEGERRSDRIRWIRSYVFEETDGSLGTVCIYEGADPEAVREHAAASDLPADEVLPVVDTVIVNQDPAKAAA
jgi:hypothetical protein